MNHDEGRAPHVSVILATYNRADLVGEAIDSVLAQTFADWELVIVDDGSTDDTEAVLARYTDPRIRSLRQSNQGLSAARNAGLRVAQGDYAIMLDSDDRQRPDCLARLVAAADARPDAVVVYGRSQAMDATGQSLPRVVGGAEPFPGHTLRSLLYGDFLSIIAALVRRADLLAAGGFDPRADYAEDWDLWLRLARQGPFVFVDAIVSDFRLHAGRMTSAHRHTLERLVSARTHILDRTFAQPDLPAEARAVRPLAYRNLYIDAALRYSQRGDWGQTRAYLRRATTCGATLPTLARFAYLAAFLRLAPRYAWVNRVSDRVAQRRRARRAGAGG
ncbi:MAG: glycosyltransferase [Anaerolineae bacterium]|jgi:glycosyltransferase involved in cell wall biosynthesis|nr:glycosyltransferase [Anaerolineae bacterium]